MARFTHPGIFSVGIGSPGGAAWDIQGGTTGVGAIQPTFDGVPLFHGEFVVIGPLCHFNLEVDFSNILSFGSGQYYVTLPFVARHNYALSDGRLYDDSTGSDYSISGDLQENTNVLKLFSIASNGKNIPFEDNVPVKLDIVDSFRIAGTYEIV